MLTFKGFKFTDLTIDLLYNLLKLRQEVFIVEQNCPYLDADDKDQVAHHVLGFDNNEILQAYTRLIPPGISYTDYSSIGRVTTAANIRGKHQGAPLMQFSIDQCEQLWPEHSIKISAQTYITRFYTNLGFVETGDEYLEDDIPHIAMIRKARN